MAIGQANGLDRCAQTEQHQHVHQHVHFTPEQLNRRVSVRGPPTAPWGRRAPA